MSSSQKYGGEWSYASELCDINVRHCTIFRYVDVRHRTPFSYSYEAFLWTGGGMDP